MAKTDFTQFFGDLPDNIADKLRGAKLKPGKIKEMADGEILAIDGIGDVALEKIRENYPVKLSIEEEPKEKEPVKEPVTPKKTRTPKKRSAYYLNWRKKVTKNKLYKIPEALQILNPSKKKPNTLELHINTTETGIRGELTLPHPINKPLNIAIFKPEMVTDIKTGKYNFDILLAKPEDMSKIAPLAKILGPKGLMPNPKNNTVTTDTDKRLKELQSGSTLTYKTEAKSPIIHINLGKTDQKPEHIETNILTILKNIGRQKTKSAFLASTQSPSTQLDLNSLTT